MGLLLVTIGTLYLLKIAGVVFPAYLFTWPMLLIGFGLVSGIKHAFRRPGWIILIAIGIGFLIAQQYPTMDLWAYFWPAALVIVGLMIIFKPRRKWGKHRHYWHKKRYAKYYHSGITTSDTEVSSEDRIELSNVFSGVQRAVISKNFQGGEISNVFGGAEVNMLQADFNSGKITLEVTNVFGGTRLILPAEWEIRSEMDSVVGGIEDKRGQSALRSGNEQKVLVLRGTNVFGGIEISSY